MVRAQPSPQAFSARSILDSTVSCDVTERYSPGTLSPALSQTSRGQRGKRKRLGTRLVRAILFEKLQEIWAMIQGDAIFYSFQSVPLIWIYFVAGPSCPILQFYFYAQGFHPGRCVNGKHPMFTLYTAISRKVVGKHVHATIPKGNMGYDQYTVPDTVAVEPTLVAFLQHSQTYVDGLSCHSFKFL